MEESEGNVFEVHVLAGEKPEVKVFVNKEMVLLIHAKVTPEDILDNFNRFLLSHIRDDMEMRNETERQQKGIFRN